MTTSSTFNPRHSSLGDILVQMGVISTEQLDAARTQAHGSEKEIGQALVALGFTTETKILKAISIRMSIPIFETLDDLIEPEAVALIPEAIARRHLVVPLIKTDDGLTLGMMNPVDVVAIDHVSKLTGIKVLPVMLSLPLLLEGIGRAYPREGEPPPETAPADESEPDAIQNIDQLLRDALHRKASDIHLEAGETNARVRFRIDGLLQDGSVYSRALHPSLVARIKILSRLDITETRLPQDGRLRIARDGKPVDVRVSTVPGVNGEKVVLRILDANQSLRQIDDLEFSVVIRASFESAIRRANRLVLVTGPTGSGKTTTLYAALSLLNDSTTNIITLEDPVEYRLDRITQIEAQPKIGLTFASGLRAILRQDPNVILVGEIRDTETADIAIQAAITGHRVFSTLHTSDAVTAVHRLITMKVEPFLIAAALGGVMAQRLVRRLCSECKKPHRPTEAEKACLAGRFPESGFFESVGCDACFQSGYAGRLPVHEWLSITPALRDGILRGASIDELRQSARADGLRGLQEDALDKASRGHTSITEVLRLTQDEMEA